MVTEDYVSFETAKLLKEKGFNEACHAFYDSGHRHLLKFVQNGLYNNAGVVANNGICVAPTLQMAMKWLREVHNLFIEIWYNTEPEHTYCDAGIYGLDNERKKKINDLSSYEEASELAIKYCLENLI